MKIGTYYYPEQWPREQWKRDFDNIAKMGLQIVHMGEFAWFEMEPRPGDIRLDWLSDCVNMAQERGLDVILCTPTAAPPVWLSRDYPETLPIQNGFVKDFGGRQHCSPTSPALREATVRIVTAMAERFGMHPSVIGWQIDNEYGAPFSTNDHTHSAFQNWLRRRYGTIDKLNHAWGCQFWNQYYTEFDQIRMPAKREPAYGNPHHHLDASRFWSHAYAEFNKLQCDILRPKIGNRWLTTNFMPFHMDLNPGDCVGEFSMYTWDSYPVSGWVKSIENQNFRIADPEGIAFMHEQMKSYTGRFGLMEVQPGTINWSGVPVHVYPGAIRLWLWTAYGHGAEFITTYRYRRPRFGIELFHDGLIGTDGVTPSQGGREFMQVIDEVKQIKPHAQTRPPSKPQPVVGILHDHEQLWQYAILPQSRTWNHQRQLLNFYTSVARLGFPVRIVRPDGEWPANMPLLIAPGLQMIDDALLARLENYDGQLLLTSRTGLMDRNGQLWEGPTAMPILPLIGADIDGYDGLPDDTFGKIEMDGTTYRWSTWGDLLKPREGTAVLATYTDQFYAGTAAVTQAGSVTYCGVVGEQSFYDALIEKLARKAGLPINVLPPRVHVLERDGLHIVVNYQDASIEAPAPAGAHFVVGERTVPPAGVAVWTQ